MEFGLRATLRLGAASPGLLQPGFERATHVLLAATLVEQGEKSTAINVMREDCVRGKRDTSPNRDADGATSALQGAAAPCTRRCASGIWRCLRRPMMTHIGSKPSGNPSTQTDAAGRAGARHVGTDPSARDAQAAAMGLAGAGDLRPGPVDVGLGSIASTTVERLPERLGAALRNCARTTAKLQAMRRERRRVAEQHRPKKARRSAAQRLLIGTRKAWLKRVADAGLEVRGAKLVSQQTSVADIARHKTAIVRRDLSQPLQLLLANGIVTPGRSVFDYGCGQGDDVAALAQHGFEAFGWDPHHASDGPRRAADVVNLGFVLNVVEDRHERAETLKAAWTFAERALSVAVMTLGKVNLSGQRPYLDGYVTTRGTFQKYYAQQELRDFIEESLGEAPVALGPGMFVVFRDKNLEQEVLLKRRSRLLVRPVGMRSPQRARRPEPGRERVDLVEQLRPQLEMLWAGMLERSRVLDADEISEEVKTELAARRVSLTRAGEMCLSELFDQEELTAAATARREDMSVHFALTLFPGAPRYAGLPRSIQRDVRAFFGSHAAALQIARELLFSVGKPGVPREAIETAIAAGVGAWRKKDSFRFYAPALNRLPPVLRVLVGCAGVLRGGVEGADFVDIKLDGPRVSFIECLDAGARLPVIAERTRVDLGRLKTFVEKPDGMVLYLKGRFLPADLPERDEQLAFDERLLSTGAVDREGRGPRLAELHELLRQQRAERHMSS